MLREEDASVVVETGHPPLERLVVEGAEDEAVDFRIGPAGGVLAHVTPSHRDPEGMSESGSGCHQKRARHVM